MTAQAKILVLNQYYWPGVEATAQLLAQLCEALAEDYDVTVVTGHLRPQPRPVRPPSGWHATNVHFGRRATLPPPGPSTRGRQRESHG